MDGFYDNDVNCTWKFDISLFWPKNVQSGVEIKITKMDIPSDEACRLDHFEVNYMLVIPIRSNFPSTVNSSFFKPKI